MAIEGWYYLHENGSLIYKRELGDTAFDIRESPFAIMLWPMDPTNRETCYTILIEAGALDCPKARIDDLCKKWYVDDDDAKIYANRIGVVIEKDGDQWWARKKDFLNLQESPAGFGDTVLEAMTNLCKHLGYKAQKMWGRSFADLCK